MGNETVIPLYYGPEENKERERGLAQCSEQRMAGLATA